MQVVSRLSASRGHRTRKSSPILGDLAARAFSPQIRAMENRALRLSVACTIKAVGNLVTDKAITAELPIWLAT